MHPHVLRRPEHPISRRQIDVIALKVLYRLIDGGFVAYLVGGAVRDLMLGRKPKDFDVGTTAHPTEVRALFRNSRLIGRRFPLVHVFFGGGRIVEVATFRANPSAPLAAAEDAAVPAGNNFGTAEQDAVRRDFTINALFYDPKTFCVLDHVCGLADLERKLVRTVGEAEARMREDPVRMVRAVRLAAKLNFALEPSLRAAIGACGPLLLEAAAPRLVEELHRLLAVDGGFRALRSMGELGLLKVLFPRWHEYLEGNAGAWQRAVQNLKALEAARASGAQFSRSMILAGLFADLGMDDASGPAAQVLAAEELRQRGFARAETARMRLLLNALRRLRARRRLDRLARQPYYGEAQSLYQLLAPAYGLDPLARAADAAANYRGVPANGARRARRRRRPRGLRMAVSAPGLSAQTIALDGQPAALCAPHDSSLLPPRS